MGPKHPEYTCTICNLKLRGKRMYGTHMADHRNQGASSSSRLVRELNNISFPSELDLGSVASSVRSTPPPNSSQPRKSISRRHVAKGKEKEHRPPQSDTIDSIQPPHQRNRQVDEASSIASPSKRARQSESPEVAAAKRTKKPRPATSKKDRVYDDNVNIFAHHDPLARELDITSYRNFINRSARATSYRPITVTGKEELRRLLHTVFDSVTMGASKSTKEAAASLIRKMDKKLKLTLVPTTMRSGTFDLKKIATKSAKLERDINASFREKIVLSFEIFHSKLETEKLKLESDAIKARLGDYEEQQQDSVEEELAIIPDRLKKHISEKSRSLAHDYAHYLKKYPSSSFSS